MATQLVLNAALGGVSSFMIAPIGVTILHLELQRRFGVTLGTYTQACKCVLARCAPEAASLVVCLTVALVLRSLGDTEIITDPVEQRVWEQIKLDWPVLLGADTLLGLQAMLRLVMFFSVVRHTVANMASAFGQSAAMLTLGAMVARMAVAAQTKSYTLDGPLGGAMPEMCIAGAAVLLLTFLGLSDIRKVPVAAMATASGAAYVAANNYMNLAENRTTDSLFILAHMLECFASFAYLARTVMIHCGPKRAKEGAATGFVHLLMPVQQGLAAYYFLTALEPSPNIIGAGRPLCVLAIANLAQLGAYLCAAAFFLAERACSGFSSDEGTVREDDSSRAALAIEGPQTGFVDL